jgi:hypothetical protein
MRKIKQISLVLVFVCCTMISHAQDTAITNPFNVDTIFSLLDVNLMPNGILIDRLAGENPLVLYDGSCNDCHTNDQSFRQLMLDLQTCRFANNTFLLDYDDVYQNYVEHNKAVPLQIVNILYDKIRDDAFSENLLQATDSLLDEGSNTSESPYNSYRFLAFRVANNIFLQGISFVIDSNFYLSNDPSFTISTIEIDFGDGQGFIEVNFGQTISPDYSGFSGEELELKVRFTSGSSTFLAIYKTEVVNCESAVPIPVAPPWATASQFQYGNIVANRTNNANGIGHAVGNAYVYYRDNPEPGTENLFKKPIIIVEGIDFGTYKQQNAANYLMGSFGWCALWGQDLKNYGQLAKMPQLLNEYHDNGYDIIMLDFKNGSADIKENAYLLQELIEKVNHYKTQDAELNVVLGASMGAIVARYALADMEQEGKEHCTRLYISFDGPQQGANIPLGAQYFINFFANNGVDEKQEAKDMWASLSTPAARQLLVKQTTTARESVHIAFFNELTSLGYPQKCNKVAIANGTISGLNQGYSGGEQIVAYDHTISNFWNIHARGNIWSQPGRSSDNLIFYGELPWRKISWNNISWGKVSDPRYSDASTPHYDNAPGGVRQVAFEIAGVNTNGNGNIEALQFNQAFIPSVSALDVSTSDLFVDIDAGLKNGTYSTPFDAYYGPTDINTFHVEATDGNPVQRGDNINFTFSKTNISAGISNTVLSSVYNYGVLENNFVHHTEVVNNGKLHLYGDLPDGVTNTTPTSGNTQEYFIGSGCIAHELKIENGGELILGDAGKGNQAILFVSINSDLKILSGGKVQVQEGSKLIIEDGANFFFEDGAEIELLGPNATLEIKGKLLVGNQATFTFSGDGRLIFDQDVKWGTNSFGHAYLKVDEYIQIGDEAVFDVEGPTTADLNHWLVEVRKPLYLRQEDGKTFDAVSIKHGRVLFHEDALMYSFSPTTLMYVHFNSIDPNHKHQGFRLWHNTGTNVIMHSKFSDGYYGALVHWFGGGSPILISNCQFNNNQTGLLVDGGNFNVNLCQFTNNHRGFRGANLTGQSVLNNSVFSSNSHFSADMHGQAGASLATSTSEFINNDVGMFLHGQINSRVICSDFSINGVGVAIESNSVLDIGDQAENSFVNHVSGQDLFMGSTFGEDIALFLDQGNNDFSARGANQGLYLFTDFHNTPLFFGGGSSINADNNKMPTYQDANNNTIMPVEIWYRPSGPNSATQGTLDIPNNLTSVDRDCKDEVSVGLGKSAFYRLVNSFPTTGGVLHSDNFSNIDLKVAVLEAIDMVTIDDEEREDATALPLLIEILSSVVSQPDAYTDKMLMAAYNKMHQALNNCFQFGGLINVQGDASTGVNDTVAAAIDVIEQYISALDASDTLQQQRYFKFHLDKVHAYRVSGHYDAALNVLSNSLNWTFDYTQTQRAAYWGCVCEAEAAYFNEEMQPEEFTNQIANCNLDYAGYNYKQSNYNGNGGYVIETKKDFNMVLYPQPTKSDLTIHLSEPFEGQLSYEIMDITGKHVQTGKTQMQGAVQVIDVSKLSQGVYMIHVQLGNTHQQTLKFVKG